MESQYTKVIERAEGQGTLYDPSATGSAVAYRLTVSQTVHVRYDRFGATRETVRERDIRGHIIAPDVVRYFGRPVTLRLEDGRTLDLLVTGADGAVRGDRDFYSV
jgi:hypothetical protein